MAEHARNTDCNVAPTARRTLLRGAAAALTGCGLAAVYLAPDPVWAAPAEQPDAELLQVCTQFCRLQDEIYAAWPAGSAIEDEQRIDAVIGELTRRQWPLVERMTELQASTVGGFRARARAWWLYEGGEKGLRAQSPCMNDRMLISLLRDLTAGGGLAAAALGSKSVRAEAVSHPDAALIAACVEFMRLEAKIDAIYAPAYLHLLFSEAAALEKARAAEAEPIEEQQAPLLEIICDARAKTLQGQATRAQALAAWDKDPCWKDTDSWNHRLLEAIMRDLTEASA